MSLSQQWFILSDGKIRGPFAEDLLMKEVQASSQPLIWGRSQSEWLTPDKWHKMLHDRESVAMKAKAPERLWRVRVGSVEMKPMNYDAMIDSLKEKADYNDVLIWTEGYSEWREVFQIHRIMDELGVGRRAHPRVPISGQIQCEGATGTFIARALSVSEGGAGMTECPLVKIGEKLKIIMKSPNLFAPLHATAEVVFVGNDGYVGMKFIGLQTESKSAIIEYVKNFLEKTPGFGAHL